MPSRLRAEASRYEVPVQAFVVVEGECRLFARLVIEPGEKMPRPVHHFARDVAGGGPSG
jgi:hypothetical protein